MPFNLLHQQVKDRLDIERVFLPASFEKVSFPASNLSRCLQTLHTSLLDATIHNLLTFRYVSEFTYPDQEEESYACKRYGRFSCLCLKKKTLPPPLFPCSTVNPLI